jgi:glutamate-1-semialdehyde aminotransferase
VRLTLPTAQAIPIIRGLHLLSLFPAVFKSAEGAYLIAEDRTAYIDFFCGVGA